MRGNMKQLIEKELGTLTQTRLAQKIGVSQATIHKILYTDTILTVATLAKLAKYFGVPITTFISDTENGDLREDLSALTVEEQNLLLRYRYLCEQNHGKDAFDFIDYLAEKHGFNSKGKDNVSTIKG
jgi:transcriptional regulator with XRE-family HTH domain